MKFIYKILAFVLALTVGLPLNNLVAKISSEERPTALVQNPPARTQPGHPAQIQQRPRAQQPEQQSNIVPQWFITLIKPGAIIGLIIGTAVMMKTTNILDSATPPTARELLLGGVYGCIAGVAAGALTTTAIVFAFMYKHLKKT